MKKIQLFIILALMFTMGSFAQLDKNTWLVGGTGSYDSYNRDYTFTYQTTGEISKIRYDTKELELSPKIGYFIIDKLAVGLSVTYTSEEYESTVIIGNSGGGSFDKNIFRVGPLARYYFLNKEKIFNILAEANYQFGNINYNSDKGVLDKFTFQVGSEIFFNSSVGMEFLLGYKIYNQKSENPYASSHSQNGFQFAIGFQIHLEKNNN